METNIHLQYVVIETFYTRKNPKYRKRDRSFEKGLSGIISIFI